MFNRTTEKRLEGSSENSSILNPQSSRHTNAYCGFDQLQLVCALSHAVLLRQQFLLN